MRARTFGTKASDLEPLETGGYAACYSADEDDTFRLPFEVETGRLIDDVWGAWLGEDRWG